MHSEIGVGAHLQAWMGLGQSSGDIGAVLAGLQVQRHAGTAVIMKPSLKDRAVHNHAASLVAIIGVDGADGETFRSTRCRDVQAFTQMDTKAPRKGFRYQGTYILHTISTHL